jgi:elongation factor Ts
MHVAATDPMVAKPEQIDPQMLAKEKEIFSAQLQSSDKPAAIIDKIVTGKLAKFKAEVSLVEQPFVKDPEVKVGALLTKANADIVTFVRFEVGQGIEVKTTDFATEVKAQAGLE